VQCTTESECPRSRFTLREDAMSYTATVVSWLPLMQIFLAVDMAHPMAHTEWPDRHMRSSAVATSQTLTELSTDAVTMSVPEASQASMLDECACFSLSLPAIVSRSNTLTVLSLLPETTSLQQGCADGEIVQYSNHCICRRQTATVLAVNI